MTHEYAIKNDKRFLVLSKTSRVLSYVPVGDGRIGSLSLNWNVCFNNQRLVGVKYGLTSLR